jgi:hypothetical protein
MSGPAVDGDAAGRAALQARLEAISAIDRGIADAQHLIPDDLTAYWRSRAQVAFARRLADLSDRLVLARVALYEAESTMQHGVESLAQTESPSSIGSLVVWGPRG